MSISKELLESGEPSRADEIREYTLVALIKPARRKRESTVTFTARDIHDGMCLGNDVYPNICGAIDAGKFPGYAGVRLVKREGPKESNTVKWTFNLAR